ncbi:mitogen-activated protein kinase kinase kinase kinase 5-like [Convolutriloba macropyga]|uniref:mitogen-activated protein kinase kinase kinase kinase 5-like n=1 Tax=Convolutriloba macropyga TaxID=536237 RepID=UPI003F51D295
MAGQRGRGGLMDAPRLDSHIRRENPQRLYNILEMIGSGSYGQVYTAVNKLEGGPEVALKRMMVKDANELAHLQVEITLLYKLDHPNIVRYYDSFYHNRCLWLIMELCSYDSLQDIYNQKKNAFNEDQIAFVMREMFGAVAYIHHQHVMHRDIKGANILLTQRGDVKLADFGVSVQTTATMDRTKTLIGTPYWMAPEMASADNRTLTYSNKCDIWALGIVAIELAHGQPPNYNYEPKQYLAVLKGRRFKSPKLSSQRVWSGDFYHFVTWTLNQNPSKRPTAEDVIRDSDFLKKPALGPALMRVFLRKPAKGGQGTNEEEEEEDEGVMAEITSTQRLTVSEQDDEQEKKVIYSKGKADTSGHAIHAPSQEFNYLSPQGWPNSSSESISDSEQQQPTQQNTNQQQSAEKQSAKNDVKDGRQKAPVAPPPLPPVDGPAPLAQSDSMFVNVSGTVSFLTPTDRNPVAPSAPPMEQSESGGVAAADESGGSDYENVSPTIRNIASSQIVVGGDGKKQSNNESAISILEYERTLRPKGANVKGVQEPTKAENQSRNLPGGESTAVAKHSGISPVAQPYSSQPEPLHRPSEPSSSEGDSHGQLASSPSQQSDDAAAPSSPSSPDKVKQQHFSGKPVVPEVLMGAMFSKVFDSVSFASHCAVTWVNPETKSEYILIASDNGVYSLDVEQVYISEPELRQIYSSRTTWMQVHENQLISISGTRKTYVCQHDLAALYTSSNRTLMRGVSSMIASRIGLAKTQKIQATRGCLKCCLTKTFNDTYFMCTQQVDRFILFQWYESKFKELHCIRLEDAFDRPLSVMSLLITDKTDYPYLCYDVEENPDNPNHYDVKVLNLDNITQTLGSTHRLEINTRRPAVKSVVKVRQLEKDTLLICFPDYIRITNLEGKLKSTRKRAVKLNFDVRIKDIVVLDSSVLVFHDHGMIGKSFETSQTTQNICDYSQTYRLLDSSGLIVVESLTQPTGELQERKRHIHVVAGHKNTATLQHSD